MMNIAATEFWLNNIYRPAGTRNHGLLKSDELFSQWLGDKDPEVRVQQVLEEARLAGRNPRTEILRYVIAQQLCKLATSQVLTPEQSHFVGQQIPQAQEPVFQIEGYTDGRTTQDWLEFIQAAAVVRRDAQAGCRNPEIARKLRSQNGGLNLDPLFIQDYVNQNAPKAHRRVAGQIQPLGQ